MTNTDAARVIGEVIECIDSMGKVRAFLSEEDVQALKHAAKVLSGEVALQVWMYSETDGDAGEYAIRLFSTKEKAEAWKKKQHSAYGHIQQAVVS